MTSFRNSSNIRCSTTLKTTDKISLCTLWYHVYKLWSTDSSTRAVKLFTAKSFMADFTLEVITFSSVQQVLLGDPRVRHAAPSELQQPPHWRSVRSRHSTLPPWLTSVHCLLCGSLPSQTMFVASVQCVFRVGHW